MRRRLIIGLLISVLAGLGAGVASAQEVAQDDTREEEISGEASGETGVEDKDGQDADVTRFMAGPDSQAERLVSELPDRMRWLETASGRFPIMATAAVGAPAQGAMILVADLGRSPAQGLIGHFHRVLPGDGWHLLSLGLPRPPLPNIPGRGVRAGLGASAASAQPDSEETKPAPVAGAVAIDLASPAPTESDIERFRAEAKARIKAAVTSLRAQGMAPLVLVGVGRGAEALTRYLVEEAAEVPRDQLAVVWINPDFSAAASPQWLADSVAWPLLDIADSSRPGQREALRGSAIADRTENTYRQDSLYLMPDPTISEAQWLGQRIQGWVRSQLGRP